MTVPHRKTPDHLVDGISETWDRIEEARNCLRRLPDMDARYKGYAMLSWPGMLAEKFIDYPKGDLRIRMPPPNAASITRMEEAMRWLTWLGKQDRDAAKVVWLCCGLGFRSGRAAKIIGRDRATVQRWRHRGLLAIVVQFQK